MGIFDSIKRGLKKTSEKLGNNVNKVFANFRKVDEELLEELEETLIISDVGMQTSLKIVDTLRKNIKLKNLKEVDEVKDELVSILIETIDVEDREKELEKEKKIEENNLTKCILVIGVNGVGKTTSIAKLANNYKNEGKKVLLVPADTFRAAAVEQITEWANRVGVNISDAKEGEDPSSVVHRALEGAKNEKYDIIIIDTAGRLHNKKNLMAELGKINNTIDKVMKDEILKETYLVLDGTTGQNAIEQSKAFSEVTNITGYILTKLDGTSKGGVIIGIADSTKIPVKYIGVGEKQDDLKKFDAEDFVRAVIS